MAGHHIQWMGRRVNASSTAYSRFVMSVAAMPATSPTPRHSASVVAASRWCGGMAKSGPAPRSGTRSEEHTSELQSQSNLVCRLLLEKKKIWLYADPVRELTIKSYA